MRISLTTSVEGFEGTVVNRALSSLHRGSLEITLTVPLRKQERSEIENEKLKKRKLTIVKRTIKQNEREKRNIGGNIQNKQQTIIK